MGGRNRYETSRGRLDCGRGLKGLVKSDCAGLASLQSQLRGLYHKCSSKLGFVGLSPHAISRKKGGE